MAELSKIRKNGVDYDIKDATARKAIERLTGVEPADNDIPKVFIDGSIPTTKDDVLAELRYVSLTEEFHSYIKIKCQGSSSMKWDKKNFTIKMYSDAARETKLEKVFKDWGMASSKYVLKANYIDHTHARNIVNARLWTEVVASRPDYGTLPAELRNSPKNGAVDGFPIIVYVNGDYQGIYTWNIGKDPWMVGMDEENANHVMLCNEYNGNTLDSASNFRALWDGSDTYYSYEIGTESDAVKASLNALIACVKDTDDATFKATIGNYLDVQSAIDYYLHQYVIIGVDGLAKNMLLLTYDMTKWILGAYDMDSTWCLHPYGTELYPATRPCPGAYMETRNLLFSRLAAHFANEMRERYIELRQSVYSRANITAHFERFCGEIGKETYVDDLVPYPSIPSADVNNIWQLRNAIRDRLTYVDAMLLGSRISYVESDGNSYVDTGVIPDSDMIVDVTLLNPQSDINYETYFGSTNKRFAVFRQGNAPTKYVNVRINETNCVPSTIGGDGYKDVGTKYVWSIDTSVAGEWADTQTMLLFAKRDDSTWLPVWYGTYQLYSFKVTRKSTSEVLIDLIPSVDANGVACLYDKQNNKVLYNSGTGVLTAHTA